MSLDHVTEVEENIFANIPEYQSLDSLLQTPYDNSSQPELITNVNNSECKIENNPELCRKRSHSESMNIYINTLKPKDVVIFIENIKYFSHGTAFMNDFRNLYMDPILKYLNGGEPLKNDFGRDLHTSAYSLFTFSPINKLIKEACQDTVRIIQIMEAFDSFKFSERNLNNTKISMKDILEKSRDEFLNFDQYRNNHFKRKRYLIYIFHSDICLEGIGNVVKELQAMKVRFSVFGVYKHESCNTLCDALNYNQKDCQDLSCFGRSEKWPITITYGLYKYFEINKINQAKNKSVKWNNIRDPNEPNEFEYINFMGSSSTQIPDNIMHHISNVISENQLNSNLNSRNVSANDTVDTNYPQPSGNITITNQNQHLNLQSKYIPTPGNNYYNNVSNQSDISKSNQMNFFSSTDQFYPTSSSVSVASHRSTPSSMLAAKSPQFHSLNSHTSLPQTPLHCDQMKPNSVENNNEIMSPMSNLSNQINISKVNPNQDDMNVSLQRFPNSNIPLNSNSNLNMNNFNSNRFIPRQQYYPHNQVRNTGTILFEGRMKYNEDLQTDLRIHIDQTIDISLLTMHCWDKQCNLHYLNYIDAYQNIIYGKSITDIDGGGTDVGLKAAIEVYIKMNQQAMDHLMSTLSSKSNTLIAIIKPYRPIPQEVYVQCICILLNRSNSGIKALIPADPRSLCSELTRLQLAHYPVAQSNQMYNQMKRHNFGGNNQQMYTIPMQRPIINRYPSHPGVSMLSVNGNPSQYRPMTHPSGFMNSQQISPAQNYILHPGQYPTNPNQSSGSYQIPMDLNMQANQNIFDPNYI